MEIIKVQNSDEVALVMSKDKLSVLKNLIGVTSVSDYTNKGVPEEKAVQCQSFYDEMEKYFRTH